MLQHKTHDESANRDTESEAKTQDAQRCLLLSRAVLSLHHANSACVVGDLRFGIRDQRDRGRFSH
jgi:hypothetical protein